MKKQLLMGMLLSLLVVCLFSNTVNAQEWPSSISVSDGFSSSWSKTYTHTFYLDPLVSITVYGTYGYDTWAFNEDYVTSFYGASTGYQCRGSVTNSNGSTANTPWVTSTSSTKADVLHSGTPVTYTGWLRNT